MPDTDVLNSLKKREILSGVNLRESSKYRASKRGIWDICESLSGDTGQYRPENTEALIAQYINTEEKVARILYSEISSYLFHLRKEQRTMFLANAERLMLYTFDSSVTEDIEKIIVKIYDHTQLVNYQMESMNNIFAQNISEEKVGLHKEIKGVEREYITILGIFAAVVLTFVGSFTFSTAVLSNIGNVSTIELAVITLIIGLVFFNLIAYLIGFLRDINDRTVRDAKGNIKLSRTFLIVNVILIVLITVFLFAFCRMETNALERFNNGVSQEQMSEAGEDLDQ